jgi:hypothetical protein
MKTFLSIFIPVICVLGLTWLILWGSISQREIRQSEIIKVDKQTIIHISHWEYRAYKDSWGLWEFINLKSGKKVNFDRRNRLRTCLNYHANKKFQKANLKLDQSKNLQNK